MYWLENFNLNSPTKGSRVGGVTDYPMEKGALFVNFSPNVFVEGGHKSYQRGDRAYQRGKKVQQIQCAGGWLAFSDSNIIPQSFQLH